MDPPMTVSLSIKNVPDDLAKRLRARAERNRRSLQRELLSILEQAATEPGAPVAVRADRLPSAQCISIDEAFARARRLFPSGTPSSTGLLREMRDGRYGIGPASKARPPKSGVR
jgi:antitoxin FitA